MKTLCLLLTLIICLFTCTTATGQPLSGRVVIERDGVRVLADSVVIHVPTGPDLMVTDEVNRLLAEQAANWLAELAEGDALRIAQTDSLQAELDAVLADYDATMQAVQDTAAALKQTITGMWDLIEAQDGAIDSLGAGWLTAFEQGQAIIAHQDSLLNAYAEQMVYWAQVAAEATAADTVEVTAPDSAGYELVCAGLDVIEAWQAEGAQADRATRVLEGLYPILQSYKGAF